MRMMGVMDFKAHGKIVTRFIRDSSLACQTDSGVGSVLRLTLRIFAHLRLCVNIAFSFKTVTQRRKKNRRVKTPAILNFGFTTDCWARRGLNC